MIPCCADCRYFEISKPGSRDGLCYRYPPLAPLARSAARFPTVATSDWCGEFAPLKK